MDRRTAYFAGLIDGDGWLAAGTRFRCHDRLAIGLTDPVPVVLAWEHFGCGAVQLRKPGERSRRFGFVWRASGKDARAVAAALAPVLILKQAKAAALAGIAPRPASIGRETRTAYFAGLVDAEGHIALTARGAATIAVGMSDEAPIVALREYFAAGSIMRREAGGLRRRPHFVWRAATRQARAIIAEILPLLIVQRTRAEVVLSAPVHPVGWKPPGWLPWTARA